MLEQMSEHPQSLSPRPSTPDAIVADELTGLLREGANALGARYGAIGILARSRLELELLLTCGLDDAQARAIGHHPRGRGVLGWLIADRRPLRFVDVACAPGAYGFPPGHPRMHSFVGAPVMIDAQAWGNLYFADKRGGAFDAADERLATELASRAAAVVYRARMAEGSASSPGPWTTPHI